MLRLLLACVLWFGVFSMPAYSAHLVGRDLPIDVKYDFSRLEQGGDYTHLVVKGETLYSISTKYNVALGDLKAWNNLSDNTILPGQKLVIKKSGDAFVATSPSSDAGSASSPTTHFVKPKQTLYSLAKQYGVTVAQLTEWNNLGAKGLLANTSIWVVKPDSNGQPIADNNVDETSNLQPPIREASPVVTEAVQPAIEAVENNNTDSTVASSEVIEEGSVSLMENADKKKYLCWHRTASIGTILKVKNPINDKEVFVRVTGRLEGPEQVILKISPLAAYRLGIDAPSFDAEVTYFK